MNDKEFRVNALCILASNGLTLKDFGKIVKKACVVNNLTKNADFDLGIGGLLSGAGNLISAGGSVALGATLASLLASLGLGYVGGRAIGTVTAPSEEDVEMEKMKDQIHSYNRAIERQRGEREAREADQELTKRKGVRISSAL